MTGGALPGWGSLFIHLMADTSWVPALGQAVWVTRAGSLPLLHIAQVSWPPAGA